MVESRRGIPTATTIDHIAFIVPDLDEAVAFFTDILGCVLLRRAGPQPADRHLASTGSMRLALLRYDDRLMIELLEYDLPTQRRTPPRGGDIGGHHLAFRVDDLATAVAYLRTQPGVAILDVGERTDGRGYACFTTPWGQELQLISYPPNYPASTPLTAGDTS